jgi:hypothetical protein
MNSAALSPRFLATILVCAIIAVFAGYLLATPYARITYAVIPLLFLSLSIPFFLRWHHPLVIVFSPVSPASR